MTALEIQSTERISGRLISLGTTRIRGRPWRNENRAQPLAETPRSNVPLLQQNWAKT
jgi:hypothetical protein